MADEEDAKEVAGRLGLLGHGAYYLLLASLVVALTRTGSAQTDAQGAIDAVLRTPYGTVLLALLVVAFAAYAVHQAVQLVDADEWLDRGKHAASTLVWGGLTSLGASELLGGGGGSSGSTRGLTARVLELPGGRWIVVAVGVALLGVAAYQLNNGLNQRLDTELHELGLDERRWARRLGSTGYVGRSAAYAATAVFVITQGLRSSSDAAGGLDSALQRLIGTAYGPPVLWGVAVGFAAFGLYRLVEARYQSM